MTRNPTPRPHRLFPTPSLSLQEKGRLRERATPPERRVLESDVLNAAVHRCLQGVSGLASIPAPPVSALRVSWFFSLARSFLGDFVEVNGFANTYYWDMPVDDNAFLLLKTDDQKAAFLHVSCTEWKNLFSFELYGRNGKLEINGL
jgi:hypothetical protein